MKKLFWGLFFITAGAVVITNQLGYFTDVNLFGLLCTIFIIPILIKSLFRLEFTGIFFSVAFLIIIYAKQLQLQAITPWPILATALLCSIGFEILFKKRFYHGHHVEHFDTIVNSDDDSEVNYRVSYGSSIKYINTEDFKSANLSCSFGALKVYFDNAIIQGESATISLDLSFAGAELYIPKEWKIVNQVDVTLGGVEEKNNRKVDFQKTVILTGRVSLSGVSIIYV